MKLAIGSGSRNYGEGWEHIDAGFYPHTKDYPMFDLLYESESIDLIFASHIIAYFSRDEFLTLLREWHRVLKKGGILRIATPDFDTMSQLYVDGKIDLKDILGPLYGRMKMGNEIIYHKTCWNFPDLYDILWGEFFGEIKKYDHKKTDHAHIDDQSAAYLNPKGDQINGTLISLNVECTKE